MQTNPLTKTEAGLLYGYGYRLVDAEGQEFEISAIMHTGRLRITFGENDRDYIEPSEIGKSFWVAVHPLSRLTTEIEGVGVPIVELATIAELSTSVPYIIEDGYMKYETEMFYLGKSMSFILISGKKSFTVKNQQSLFAKMYAWHFDTMNFLERGIGKEINLK